MIGGWRFFNRPLSFGLLAAISILSALLGTAFAQALVFSVEAGSSGNEAHIYIRNPSDEAVVKELQVAIFSQPPWVTNVTLSGDSQGVLQPDSIRDFTVRFGITAEAPNNITGALVFSIEAEPGVYPSTTQAVVALRVAPAKLTSAVIGEGGAEPQPGDGGSGGTDTGAAPTEPPAPETPPDLGAAQAALTSCDTGAVETALAQLWAQSGDPDAETLALMAALKGELEIAQVMVAAKQAYGSGDLAAARAALNKAVNSKCATTREAAERNRDKLDRLEEIARRGTQMLGACNVGALQAAQAEIAESSHPVLIAQRQEIARRIDKIAAIEAIFETASQHYFSGDLETAKAALGTARAQIVPFGGTCPDLLAGLERREGKIEALITALGEIDGAIGRCDGEAMNRLSGLYAEVGHPLMVAALGRLNEARSTCALVDIPNVVGLDLADATALIIGAGLRVVKNNAGSADEDNQANVVTRQSRKGLADPETEITLTYFTTTPQRANPEPETPPAPPLDEPVTSAVWSGLMRIDYMKLDGRRATPLEVYNEFYRVSIAELRKNRRDDTDDFLGEALTETMLVAFRGVAELLQQGIDMGMSVQRSKSEVQIAPLSVKESDIQIVTLPLTEPNNYQGSFRQTSSGITFTGKARITFSETGDRAAMTWSITIPLPSELRAAMGVATLTLNLEFDDLRPSSITADEIDRRVKAAVEAASNNWGKEISARIKRDMQ